MLRRAGNTALLGGSDGLLRSNRPDRPAVPNLDEYQCLIISHHQIQLTKPAAIVGGNCRKPTILQVALADAFGLDAGCKVGRSANGYSLPSGQVFPASF